MIELFSFIMIDEDDCFCYDYDCGRLYQAVIEIFGETLHYLVPKEIESGDGQGIYRKIMMHLNGQRAKDAENAREIFNNYKMNDTLKVWLDRNDPKRAEMIEIEYS